MTAQLVEIDGKRIALLPEEDYRRLLAMAEELDEVRAFDQAEQREKAGEEYVPFALAERIVRGENPLKVWREHRQLTQKALAAESGIEQSKLSRLENGVMNGKPAQFRSLARVLRVDVDDIMP